MPPEPLIRSATAADAEALLALYRPYIEQTTVSFETEVPSVEAFAGRIRDAVAGWAWLVAEVEGTCAGYAYGGAHRARAAYRWSVETSAYVDAQHHRRGIARALYTALFDVLRQKGYCHAFAGVTLPNAPSVAFHQQMGFESIGVFKSVGYKFGHWHDVAWFQRPLRAGPPPEHPTL